MVKVFGDLLELPHDVLGEPLPPTPVHQNATVVINPRQVNRRTLHLRIREAKLRVDIVDALQKIGEIAPCGAYGNIVAEISVKVVRCTKRRVNLPQGAEITDKTTAEEVHEAVVRSGGDFSASCCQGGHDMVGVDLVRVEDGVFAIGDLEDFIPDFLAVFQLAKR